MTDKKGVKQKSKTLKLLKIFFNNKVNRSIIYLNIHQMTNITVM